jgi:hypothetical protein
MAGIEQPGKPLEPDRDQIEIFVEALFRHCATKDGGGIVSLRAFYEGSDNVARITPISLKGGLRFLMEAAEDDARRAANSPKPAVFCPPVCTFATKAHAREQDLLEGPALSAELDAEPKAAMEKLAYLLGPPTVVVRSGGIWTNPTTGEQEDKLHAHWRLNKPARGKDDLAKLKRAREISTALVGGDPTNVPVCHPIRWPGSWHKKSAPRLCQIISTDLDREIDLDTALAALEKITPQKKTNGQARPQQSGSDQESDDWDKLVGNVMRGENLHYSLTRLAMKLLRADMTDAAAVRHLRALLCVSQAERDERWQQRFDYIPRAVSTAREKIDKNQKPAPAPKSLADVHNVFIRWLGEEYDLDTLDATLAVTAGERLPGDPPWLLIVSGPGNAKTETVQATSGLKTEVISTISSEGALLSASRRGKHATGGLLRKIGDHGILAIKDFTSILSCGDRNTRAAILAALREIHDGRWVRNVGIDGGQTLEWLGRIVVIAACTTAWDQAHGVIAIMGDRFVLIRPSSYSGRISSGLHAIRNTGSETAMRKELAEAVAGLINNIDTKNAYKLTPEDSDIILRAADLVTRARTGVERDYRGDVIDAHDPEMPTRFAKQLTQIMRGAIAIGMEQQAALKLVLRCAKDSIPQLRLALLIDLASHPHSPVIDIRRRLQRPRMTTDRTLQELHVLGLLICEEEEEHRGEKIIHKRFYSLARDTNPDALSPKEQDR